MDAIQRQSQKLLTFVYIKFICYPTQQEIKFWIPVSFVYSVTYFVQGISKIVEQPPTSVPWNEWVDRFLFIPVQFSTRKSRWFAWEE